MVVYAGDVLEGLPAGGSIDDVEDVGAAIELILEAARSAQPSAQQLVPEPVQLLRQHADPPEPPAQPSAQPALKQVGKGADQFTLGHAPAEGRGGRGQVRTESPSTTTPSRWRRHPDRHQRTAKLGTRIKPTPNFLLPNIYLVVVAPTGSAVPALPRS